MKIYNTQNKANFVKSIVDSDDFRNAIHRIIAMPVTSWKQNIKETLIKKNHWKRLKSIKIKQNLKKYK